MNAVLLPDTAVPGADLPVRQALPALRDALDNRCPVVLEAPPGTGKTTLVPLAIADRLPGRVIVAQPRRVAARAAAQRMAALTGTKAGTTVGYTVRGQSRTSPQTRVEVVTTGVLVQRLQRDPELPGVAAVMIDESHERHIDTDLACAFCVDVRGHLREDLVLVAASATSRTRGLVELLGENTRVVTACAPMHPVETVWVPPPRHVAPSHGLRVDPRLLDHVASTVEQAWAAHDGDVLVFLPGAGEIAAVARRLPHSQAEVLSLHGSQPSGEQDAVLRPGSRRRIILATAVAESSLTVPGVRVVVDAGLARQARTDHARGLGGLVTVRLSKDAAIQRAGRAGRQGPGTVYRCWSQAENERLPAHDPPEIAVADLTAFALHLARWGEPRGDGLALPDVPAAAALDTAISTLISLGALDGSQRVTPRGRRIADVGTHPRLARALLDGAARVGRDRAAELVAVLSSDRRPRGDDLLAEWRRLRAGHDRVATAAWSAETARLRARLPPGEPARSAVSDDHAAAWVAGTAFPERVARRRPGSETMFLMSGGTAAELDPASSLRGAPWLAIAAADRQPGSAAARIRLAAGCDAGTASEAAAALRRSSREVDWSDGDVRARCTERIGAIVLSAEPADPEPEELARAWSAGLRAEGLGLLRFGSSANRLRQRLAFCFGVFGEPWPQVDDEALRERMSEWLGPELSTARRRADLERIDLTSALRRLVPWQQATELDRMAPDRITIPSGSSRPVDYTDPSAPALEAKLQEFFGTTTTPTVAAGRVRLRLRLLSPAGRPAAITGDLESFWRNGYTQVRAELRGRYPKHPWPVDPATAEPTAGTKRRR